MSIVCLYCGMSTLVAGICALPGCESHPNGRNKAHDSWDEIEDWERNAWRETADAAIAAALPALRRQWAEDAANEVDRQVEEFLGEEPDEPRNSPWVLGARDTARIVREYGETGP